MNEFTKAIVRLCLDQYPNENIHHRKMRIESEYWKSVLGEIGSLFWGRGMEIARLIVHLEECNFESAEFADLLNEHLERYFYNYWLPNHPEYHLSEITEDGIKNVRVHQLEMF